MNFRTAGAALTRLSCLVVLFCAGCATQAPPADPRPTASVDQQAVARPDAAVSQPVADVEPARAPTPTPALTEVATSAAPAPVPAGTAAAPVKPLPATGAPVDEARDPIPVAPPTMPETVPAVAVAAHAEPAIREPEPVRPIPPKPVTAPASVTPVQTAHGTAGAASPADAPSAKANEIAPISPVTAANRIVLRGQLDLVAQGRQKLDPGEVSEAVVYFRPSKQSEALKPGRYTMYTRNKAFDPSLLVVSLGSTVVFPNNDPILHNVYSSTPGQAFDFGFYGEGESRQYVFDRAGLVLVSCNVHHVMAANVLVLDTPYFTRPDASGHFELANLPAGLGELVFWHPRGKAETQALALPSNGAVIKQRLNINRPRLGATSR